MSYVFIHSSPEQSFEGLCFASDKCPLAGQSERVLQEGTRAPSWGCLEASWGWALKQTAYLHQASGNTRAGITLKQNCTQCFEEM